MRSLPVDILRFLGLAMIILAHVQPPSMLFQLRNFDVPLMMIVSGMSFALSYHMAEPYLAYLKKRLYRLVFPVWLFLTGYFLALFVISPNHSELTPNIVITSYSLLGGIGYVWIIMVFLLVALVSPFIYHYHLQEKSHRKYFTVLVICLAANELFRFLTLPYIQSGFALTASLISHYILPYSILFALGLRMTQLNKLQLTKLSLFSLAALLATGYGLYLLYGEFIPTQAYKFPPAFYYLAYAITIASLLWLFSAVIESFLEKIKMVALVQFIAQNSIWIYLWHIPLVKNIQLTYGIKYLLVFSLAIIITYIQVSFVRHLLLKLITNTGTKKTINTLFTG